MRYNWIKLYGYGGIYNGLGLNSIEIDFSKCIFNKIIIRGKNGSGKSTILNAINPYPDTNDNFMNGVPARKIISISHQGIEYIIRYEHPVNGDGSRGTTKGYISKSIDNQLIELNSNGNISSCKDILFDEFNLDNNYVTLSRLSSENRGLVDSKPAERKRFINNIISVVGTYNSIYKTLTKKSSMYKTMINSIASKIDYIGDEKALAGNLANIENRISLLEKDKDEAIEASAALKWEISNHEVILRDNNADNIMSEIATLSKDIAGYHKIINDQCNEYGIDDINKIKEFISFIDSRIIRMQAEVDSDKRSVEQTMNNREKEYSELQDMNAKLQSLQSDFNYIDLKKLIAELEERIQNAEEAFKTMGLSDADLITRDEFIAAMKAIDKILREIESLRASYYADDISNSINEMVDAVDIDKLKSSYNDNLSELSNLEKEIAIFEVKRSMAEELKNRPSECKIDSCHYIKAAIDADREYPESKFNVLITKLNNLKETIKIKEEYMNGVIKYKEIKNRIRQIYDILESNIHFLMKLPISKDMLSNIIDRIADRYDDFNDLRDLYKFVDVANILDQYKLDKSQLSKYLAEYKIYESKASIIDSLISSIEILDKKCNDMIDLINNLNSAIVKNEFEIEQLKILKSKIEDLDRRITEVYNVAFDRYNELEDIKKKFESHTTIIADLQQKLDILNKNIGGISSDIKALTEQRDSIKHSLILLEDYKAEFAMYNEEYLKIEKIRYYSSSSTGIQTLFMQLYMNRIISTANELLSLLFEGELVLQPFIINEGEFRIPCLCNGMIHDDISSMSTAQKSMVSMILSFALLHQSSTCYNVILMDEIDGGLDNSNRSFFTVLLDRLMKLLNCEQCFMISHNTELDTSMADLIVLKSDPNEMYNGNVIWKY